MGSLIKTLSHLKTVSAGTLTHTHPHQGTLLLNLSYTHILIQLHTHAHTHTVPDRPWACHYSSLSSNYCLITAFHYLHWLSHNWRQRSDTIITRAPKHISTMADCLPSLSSERANCKCICLRTRRANPSPQSPAPNSHCGGISMRLHAHTGESSRSTSNHTKQLITIKSVFGPNDSHLRQWGLIEW